MFENVLYQDATSLLSTDIKRGTIPKSILLSGPQNSGKLTAALEIARVLSCTENPVGEWLCRCPSCLMHKSLSSTNVLIAGSRSVISEIAGAKKTLIEAYQQNAPWIQASRYLFVRSIRKLTNRFNQELWGDDDKASKVSPLISSIDEILEEIDPLQPLIEFSEFEKASTTLQDLCEKLEGSFMYESIPISHIRRAQTWAHYTISSGKRVFIIEQADKMQESVRNALLKILEEPPEHCMFILTTENRNAVMPTILSRVRTYSFVPRNTEQNNEVLTRIFRVNETTLQEVVKQSAVQCETVLTTYLNSFLPISSESISDLAKNFIDSLEKKEIPNLEELLKNLKNFEPRVMLKLFFNAIIDEQRKKIITASASHLPNVTEHGAIVLDAVKVAHTNISIYNQSIQSAFDTLIYSVLRA